MPRLPFLGELLPGEMLHGIVLVEFEPQSLWYEASFTMAAHALREGIQTQYHSFTHLPSEVEESLARMGIDVRKFGELGLFEIMDSYTVTTGLGHAGQPKPWWFSSAPDQKSWGERIAARIQDHRAKGSNARRSIHIDDNMSVLLEHDSEAEIISHFRRRIIPMSREGNETYVNAIMKGVGSESFVKQLESLSDALIECKTDDSTGKIEHFARVRSYRGQELDSSWKKLVLKDTGETAFVSGDQIAAKPDSSNAPSEFEFESERSGIIFRQLVSDFLRDYMVSNYMQDKSGWRSIVDIARETSIPVSSLYSRGRNVTTPFRELVKRGMIEMKLAPGERGRGGKITRVRIAYEKAPVKDYVNRLARSVAKIERK